MPGPLLLAVCLLAGLAGALTGLGGGVVLIPILTFFGLDIKSAIALSALSVIAISNGAAASYVRRHIPNLKVEAFCSLLAVLGALIGASVSTALDKRPLFILCGAVILLSCSALWKKPRRAWEPVTRQDALSSALAFEGSYYDDAESRTVSYQGRHAAWAAPLVFAAGAVSGLLGIGGSAFIVLLHDVVIGLPPKVSLTTSNLTIGAMGLASASVFLEAGLIDPLLAIPVIVGVPLGAWIGSRLFLAFTNQLARALAFSALGLWGVQLIWHGLRHVP